MHKTNHNVTAGADGRQGIHLVCLCRPTAFGDVPNMQLRKCVPKSKCKCKCK